MTETRYTKFIRNNNNNTGKTEFKLSVKKPDLKKITTKQKHSENYYENDYLFIIKIKITILVREFKL